MLGCGALHRMVHDGRAPLCIGCTTPYWWCTMVVHHCAPSAQRHMGGARWPCTIVHRVHNSILVVHDGRAPLCTGSTTPYWWCTVAVHHCAPGAQRHIGGARWSCTIVHLVHNSILVLVHNGRAPLCTGCTTPFWWCTMVVHHCAPGAQLHIGGPSGHPAAVGARSTGLVSRRLRPASATRGVYGPRYAARVGIGLRVCCCDTNAQGGGGEYSDDLADDLLWLTVDGSFDCEGDPGSGSVHQTWGYTQP